jgi:hypothetical protein
LNQQKAATGTLRNTLPSPRLASGTPGGDYEADEAIMEAGDMVEGAIRGCASFGHQHMDVGMKIDALSESLDHGHHSWHEHLAGGCMQKLHKCAYRTKTEIIEELSLEAKEQPKHLGNGKDNLAVGDIKEKLCPYPLAPLLAPLGMTRRTETSGLAREAQEAFLSTIWTADAGKPAHRIATVEILLNNILDYGTEIAILSLKPALVLSEKLLKIMKEHPIKNSVFRMTLAVDPCHGSRDDSKNGPKWRLADIQPYKRPSLIQALFVRISIEVDFGRIF